MSSGPGGRSRSSDRRTSKPSIYDVAERAGVSHMTVSRVLNGHPNIRESTREKVLQAISEVNYTRSSIARALATNRTMRIGVLVDSPVEVGPSSTLRAIEAAARSRGYSVSAVAVEANTESAIDEGVTHLVGQGIDALCVIAPRDASLRAVRRQVTAIPLLAVTAHDEPDILTASVDQRAGAAIAVAHLRDLGHQRIAHLAGPQDWVEARVRASAWRGELEDAGLPVPPMLEGDWTSDFGYWAATEADWVGTVADATAVFCANDQLALGFVHGLHTRGVRVPEQISVVGWDDLPDAAHFLPPLTSVRQDFASLGELSVATVLDALEGADGLGRQGRLAITPTLSIRESTAPPA